jgi:hypothetical protein
MAVLIISRLTDYLDIGSIFYNMPQNSIITLTKEHNKNEVTLYCRKYDPDFAH